MNRFLVAALLAGVTAAIPGSLYAQPNPGGQPGGGHPGGGGHPAPAMHAPHMAGPAAHFHATMHRPVSHGYAMHHPVSHGYARHRVAHHHRPAAHVTIHRHHVAIHTGHIGHHTVHHMSAAVHGRSHISARVAGLRKNVHAAHRFHAGAYRAPPGYNYRRWGYGEFLPSAFWGRDYWLTDFLAFGLFAPPDGYIWVRYGPDAMLIDEYTGEILQVDYGVFY